VSPRARTSATTRRSCGRTSGSAPTGTPPSSSRRSGGCLDVMDVINLTRSRDRAAPHYVALAPAPPRGGVVGSAAGNDCGVRRVRVVPGARAGGSPSRRWRSASAPRPRAGLSSVGPAVSPPQAGRPAPGVDILVDTGRRTSSSPEPARAARRGRSRAPPPGRRLTVAQMGRRSSRRDRRPRREQQRHSRSGQPVASRRIGLWREAERALRLLARRHDARLIQPRRRRQVRARGRPRCARSRRPAGDPLAPGERRSSGTLPGRSRSGEWEGCLGFVEQRAPTSAACRSGRVTRPALGRHRGSRSVGPRSCGTRGDDRPSSRYRYPENPAASA
jgi:hypothetical protein